MRFSQRKGLTPVRVDVQKASIDAPLRNRLWSALCALVFEISEDDYHYKHDEDAKGICKRLWLHHFDRPLDTVPQYGMTGLQEAIRPWFMGAKWFEVYDLLEAVAGELKGKHQHQFVDLVNAFLIQDQSAYRFVDGRIADLTSQEEIDAIETALSDAHPLVGVRTHLEAALALLTDRKTPDFRNSVKESISAVESMCQALTGDTSASLGRALKKLEDSGIVLHPAIEQSWLKLYGYSSDAGGIRHALSAHSDITRADAKYMLVTCSAFVSFLTEQAVAAKIKLGQ